LVSTQFTQQVIKCPLLYAHTLHIAGTFHVMSMVDAGQVRLAVAMLAETTL